MISVERRHDPHATEQILRALPFWFGIESAIQGYAKDAESNSYLAVHNDNSVGVALLEPHFPSPSSST